MPRLLKGFQVENVENGFIDNLNDSSIHSNWTQDAGSSTIVEDGTDLTISDSGGSSLEWHTSFDAPNINLSLEAVDFTAKVYVSGLSVAANNGGGMAHYATGLKSDRHSIIVENNGSNDFILTRSVTQGLESIDLGSAPGQCWLAMMRRGDRMFFCYSTNAVTNEPDINDMTLARTYDISFVYNNTRLALYAQTQTGNPAIAIEFRKFKLIYP